MNHQTLFIGGARSGKSTLAERFVETHTDLTWIYVATAQAFDQEMTDRLAAHRARRPAKWHTVEEPFLLPEVLHQSCQSDTIVLVDCLTLWLSNLMLADHDITDSTRQLLTTAAQLPGRLVWVTNEVGQGIVPETPLGRRFRDAQGVLNQEIAAQCDRVVLVTAGLPLTIKGSSCT